MGRKQTPSDQAYDLKVDDLISPQEAAGIFKVTPRTIRNLYNRGELRGVRIGNQIRVSRADVNRKADCSAVKSPK